MWCLSISYHMTLIYRKTCQHKLGRSKGNNNKNTKAQTLFFTSSQELESRVLPSTAFSFLFTTPPPTMNNEINNKTGNKCYSTIHSLRRPVNNPKPHHPQHCLAIFSPKTGDSHRFGLTFCRSIGSCSVCLLRE